MHRVSNHAAAAGSWDFLGYKKNHTEQSQARASCMNFISFTRTQITYVWNGKDSSHPLYHC